MWKNAIRVGLIALGLLVGGAAAVSLTGLASGNGQDAAPRQMPYVGKLAHGGAPFTGTVDLRFTLVSDGEREQWAELHPAVSVENGRFGVVLGAVGGEVPDWAFDADAVYLRAEVRQDGGPWAAFGGQQRLHPAAASYWAAETDRVVTDGPVSVAGNFQLQGTSARFETLVVRSSFYVPGQLRPTAGRDGGLTFAPGLQEGATAGVQLVEENGENWVEFQVDGAGSQIVLESGSGGLIVGDDKIILAGGGVVPDTAATVIRGPLSLVSNTLPITLHGERQVGRSNRNDVCIWTENPNNPGCQRPAMCVLTKADVQLSNSRTTGGCRMIGTDHNDCPDDTLHSLSFDSSCASRCLN